MFILLDKDNIVRCMASEECNIWARNDFSNDEEPVVKREELTNGKLQQMELKIIETNDYNGIVGDEYNEVTKKTIPHPENYPQPSAEQVREKKINERMQQLMRDQAIAELTAEGEI